MIARSKSKQTFLSNKINASDQVTIGFSLYLIGSKSGANFIGHSRDLWRLKAHSSNFANQPQPHTFIHQFLFIIRYFFVLYFMDYSTACAIFPYCSPWLDLPLTVLLRPAQRRVHHPPSLMTTLIVKKPILILHWQQALEIW